MAVLGPPQIADLVTRHFPAGTVPQTGISIRETACAVAHAESGWNTAAVGDGGHSFGLWQINLPSHPQYSAGALLDPEQNASAALAISSGGRNWNPWCTWEPSACGGAGRDAYRAWLPLCASALAAPPPTPSPPPPSPPPPPVTPPLPPLTVPVAAGMELAFELLLLVAGSGALLLAYEERRSPGITGHLAARAVAAANGAVVEAERVERALRAAVGV